MPAEPPDGSSLQKVCNMLSRRSFLTGLSAASTYALGQRVSQASAREMLASVFQVPHSSPVNPERWRTFGRIMMRRLHDSVLIADGFAVHDGVQGDCEFSFSARAPEGAEEVQIWAGIRCRDRDSRYVFALRGGNNDDLYLARYAPDGEARFLGLAPLDFHPVPEPGTRCAQLQRTIGFRSTSMGKLFPGSTCAMTVLYGRREEYRLAAGGCRSNSGMFR